jgi:hypothetical protein
VGIHDLHRKRLCEALRADFDAAPATEYGPMSVKYMAAALDKSEEWVYAVKRGEIIPSIWDLLRWEEVTEGTRALEWLCARRNLMTVPMPTAGDPACGEMAELWLRVSDYGHRMAEIYRDGKVDAREAALNPELERVKADLIRAIQHLDARFDRDCERVRSGRALTMREAEAIPAKERRHAR